MKKELKPFVPEEAKYGDKLILGTLNAQFIGISFTEISSRCIIETADGVQYARVGELKIAPLGYIEGQPVYAGDRVYGKIIGKLGVVVGASKCDDINVRYETGTFGAQICYLLWEKPKQKKVGWVNLYRMTGYLNLETKHPVEFRGAAPYLSEEAANASADGSRIACVKVEWEE